MADTKTTLTWLLRDQVSGTAKKIEGTLQGAATKAGGMKGAIGGLAGGLLGMVSPAGLAVAGVGALTAGLGLALNKAKDHEVVLAKLNTTLAANVKGYDGNRDAIDKYIEKQTDAGFTVDETTNSLAQLVTATGDVQKAQEFQQAAEDLARLKGISLADATDAMTKIEAGRFRGLAQLGIVLEKGATVTDALRAVQKVAAGQADAYGKTVEGSFSKMNAKFDDAMTKIGEGLMPILAGLASFFADTVIPAIGAVVDAIAKLVGWIIDAVKWFGHLIGQSDAAAESLKKHKGEGGYAQHLAFDQHRAMGGPVQAGGAYLVGERGPEMLIMGDQGGRVIPNGSMGGGTPVSIPIMLDGREIARVVDRNLYYLARNSAPSRLRY